MASVVNPNFNNNPPPAVNPQVQQEPQPQIQEVSQETASTLLSRRTQALRSTDPIHIARVQKVVQVATYVLAALAVIATTAATAIFAAPFFAVTGLAAAGTAIGVGLGIGLSSVGLMYGAHQLAEIAGKAADKNFHRSEKLASIKNAYYTHEIEEADGTKTTVTGVADYDYNRLSGLARDATRNSLLWWWGLNAQKPLLNELRPLLAEYKCCKEEYIDLAFTLKGIHESDPNAENTNFLDIQEKLLRKKLKQAFISAVLQQAPSQHFKGNRKDVFNISKTAFPVAINRDLNSTTLNSFNFVSFKNNTTKPLTVNDAIKLTVPELRDVILQAM